MGKKLKKETKAESDDVFEPLTIESRQAQTVVIMLTSPEESVQAKACESIYKYVYKTDENRKVLFELGACEPLLKLLTSEDRTVRRNSVMALSVMAAHPDVRAHLRKQTNVIPIAIKLLGPDETITTHEFAGLLLSYMASDFSSKVLIAQSDGLSPLVACLAESDPDVQKNALDTIALMLQDSEARTAIRAPASAGIEPILNLTQSEFPVIQQVALNSLALIAQEADNRAQLRELGALERFVEIIGTPEMNDLHVSALNALAVCLDDSDSLVVCCCSRMKENKGMARLIAFITDTQPTEEEAAAGGKGDKGGKGKGKKAAAGGSAKKKPAKGADGKGAKEGEEEEEHAPSHTLPEAKIHACHAIARCARNEANRKLLHECEVVRMLIVLLGHEEDSVKAAAAQALSVLAESSVIRVAIGDLGGIEPLVKAANTRSDKTDLKESALAALVNLTTACSTNCKSVVSAHGVEVLMQSLGVGSADDDREFVAAHAATVLINLSTEEPFKTAVVRGNVVKESLKPLVSGSPMVQSRGCLLVASYICENELRNDFRVQGGLDRLVPLLKSYNEEVRRNASWALNVVIADETAAKTVCALGGLQILHEQMQSETRRSRFTEIALQKLLDHYLSAKFAYTSRLERTDVIADGFFDVGSPLRIGVPMPAIEELLAVPLNASQKPVLLVNAKPDRHQSVTARSPESVAEESEGRSSSAKSNRSGITKSMTQAPTDGIGSENETPEAGGESAVTRTQPDTATGTMAGTESGASTSAVAAARSRSRQQTMEQAAAELPTDNRLYKFVEETSKIPLLVSLRDQVVTLARYVADKLGGPVEESRVAAFSFELHVAQLRAALRGQVIPLGAMQAGHFLHRALLFKVLADRIALPCTLVRSEYNRAWNEVWLVDEGRVVSARNPARKYIVDLMHEPGRLLQDNSPDALRYTHL